MLILTAFNSAFSEIGSLCVQSLMRYCREHPEYRFVSCLIPDNYSRPPSWYKLELLKKHLPDHDFVLWIDSDALIVGSNDIKSLIKDATLNISEDKNGINCGVMAWKNCPESFKAIERMESMHEEHRDHPWFEQSALMTFVDELDVNLVPKHIFNAYQYDVCSETQILHFPGMGDGRLDAMKEAMAA